MAITASRSLLAHAGLRMGRLRQRVTIHRRSVAPKVASVTVVSATQSTASISLRRNRLTRVVRRVCLKPGRALDGTQLLAWRVGASVELSDGKASRGESMWALRLGILPETPPQEKLSGKKTVHFVPAQQFARARPQLSYNYRNTHLGLSAERTDGSARQMRPDSATSRPT